jgi:hypothetical protein
LLALEEMETAALLDQMRVEIGMGTSQLAINTENRSVNLVRIAFPSAS